MGRFLEMGKRGVRIPEKNWDLEVLFPVGGHEFIVPGSVDDGGDALLVLPLDGNFG